MDPDQWVTVECQQPSICGNCLDSTAAEHMSQQRTCLEGIAGSSAGGDQVPEERHQEVALQRALMHLHQAKSAPPSVTLHQVPTHEQVTLLTSQVVSLMHIGSQRVLQVLEGLKRPAMSVKNDLMHSATG